MTGPRRLTWLDRAVAAVRPYSKAIAGFFGPGVALVAVGLSPTSPGGSAITGDEWAAAAAAVLLGSFAVYLAPRNTPPR